jgi:aminomethyltransferase
MKHTAFTKFHEIIGAKMVPFAGYSMPLQYEGVNTEHEHVRSKIGVFDVSHMGEIWVKGPNALAFTQYVTSNDVSVLYDGKVQYSCFPNEKGGIVDDLLVYQINTETYLLVVNASNIEKDWNWLCQHAPKFNLEVGKDLYNASDEIAQLAVQGPLAMKAMEKICSEKVEDMEYYTFKKLQIAGADVIFSTTGYTGSGGCEIYMDNKDAEKVWNAVFEAGKEFDIKPIGLAARDTLRLEMGFCLYGNDINDTTSPIEAGLGWITKFNELNRFINYDELYQQKQFGPQKSLRGFEMIDRGIPRQHYTITDAQGNVIGEVTSGTMGPSLKKAIGMGYIDSEYAKTGLEIYIDIREKLHKAVIVKLPFYKG